MKQYVIVKKNNRYYLIGIKFDKDSFFKTLNGRLYKKVIREKVEWKNYDSPGNTGARMRKKTEKVYLGKIIKESDNIEEIALEYSDLVKKEKKYD